MGPVVWVAVLELSRIVQNSSLHKNVVTKEKYSNYRNNSNSNCSKTQLVQFLKENRTVLTSQEQIYARFHC